MKFCEKEFFQKTCFLKSRMELVHSGSSYMIEKLIVFQNVWKFLYSFQKNPEMCGENKSSTDLFCF